MRLVVALDARQLVVFKKNRDTVVYGLVTAFLEAVYVIPAFRVKNIDNQRRAHGVTDLTLAHPGVQLIHHLLRDDIALWNIDLVNPGDMKRGTSGADKACTADRSNEKLSHHMNEVRGMNSEANDN